MKLRFFWLAFVLSSSLLIGKSTLANDEIIVGQSPEGQTITEIVNKVKAFMLAAMNREKSVIDQHLAPNAKIIFTGGRQFSRPEEIGKFNADRYQWVKKSIEKWDVTYQGNEIIVYSLGTLYGAWPDGTEFEGNRYIDRFVIVDDKITEMEVWNDSAELILLRKE